MRKNILYITSRFPSITTTFIANEMVAVSQAGNKVTVATIWEPFQGHDGHPVEKAFLPGVVTSSLKSFKNWLIILKCVVTKPSVVVLFLQLLPGHLKSPWLFAKLFCALPKGLIIGNWAKKNDIDLIHAHFITIPTTVALFASKSSKIPYTATAHAFDITSKRPLLVNGSVEIKCKEAAAIVTISNYNKTDILTRWPALKDIDLRVIFNGIDTELFRPVADDNESDSQQYHNPVKILSVSSLNEKKGFAVLIEAANLLLKSGENIQLDIYGDGPLRSELQAQINDSGIAESVHLLGPITQSELADIYPSSDIFALACVPMKSGDADGLPTVLIESLSAKLPTVSTQVTGIPEIIIDGKTGFCVEANNPSAMADALKTLIHDSALAREFAENGRILVEEKFDRNRAASELNDLWNEFLSKRL